MEQSHNFEYLFKKKFNGEIPLKKPTLLKNSQDCIPKLLMSFGYSCRRVFSLLSFFFIWFSVWEERSSTSVWSVWATTELPSTIGQSFMRSPTHALVYRISIYIYLVSFRWMCVRAPRQVILMRTPHARVTSQQEWLCSILFFFGST